MTEIWTILFILWWLHCPFDVKNGDSEKYHKEYDILHCPCQLYSQLKKSHQSHALWGETLSLKGILKDLNGEAWELNEDDENKDHNVEDLEELHFSCIGLGSLRSNFEVHL